MEQKIYTQNAFNIEQKIIIFLMVIWNDPKTIIKPDSTTAFKKHFVSENLYLTKGLYFKDKLNSNFKKQIR